MAGGLGGVGAAGVATAAEGVIGCSSLTEAVAGSGFGAPASAGPETGFDEAGSVLATGAAS